MRAAIPACLIAMLLLAQSAPAANAHGGGFGARGGHFALHYRSPRGFDAFRRSRLRRNFVVFPAYAPANSIGYPPIAPFELSCLPVQQTVIVPSEDGGARQVTVTRCYP